MVSYTRTSGSRRPRDLLCGRPPDAAKEGSRNFGFSREFVRGADQGWLESKLSEKRVQLETALANPSARPKAIALLRRGLRTSLLSNNQKLGVSRYLALVEGDSNQKASADEIPSSAQYLCPQVFKQLLVLHHEACEAERERFERELEPMLRNQFSRHLENAIRMRVLPPYLRERNKRRVQIDLADRLNVSNPGSAFADSGRGWITPDIADRMHEVYSHERTHLLAGLTYIREESNGSVDFRFARGGLRFRKTFMGNSPQTYGYRWLNEALTQAITMRLREQSLNPSMGSFYHAEQRLVQVIAERCQIPFNLLIDAYFEECDRQYTSSAWSRISSLVARSMGPGFLQKIDQIVQVNGLAPATEYAKSAPAAPTMERRWVGRAAVSQVL